MGNAIDTISGSTVNPAGAFVAWTLATGDSLTIRNSDPTKMIYLLDFWKSNQTAGSSRIRSPKLHDNVQGIRHTVTTTNFPLIDNFFPQRLYAQDTLIVEDTGGAVGQTDVGSLSVWYEDLQGVAGRFIMPDEVRKRGVNQVTVRNTIVQATGPNYAASVALNATDDLLIANTDYALVGYTLDTAIGTISWRGADTGNLRVSGPGNITLRQFTREWFANLSMKYGLPCIPVFNSANKAGILVDGVFSNVAGNAVVESILIQLAPR